MSTSDLLRLLTFEDSNTRLVMAGTALLGLASGVVGSFAVLRKRALMGDAVAHAALPGICIAYLLVGDRSFGAFLIGALVIGTLAAWSVALVRRWTRVREDAAIAMAIGGYFGLGVVLSSMIQRTPGGNKAGLDGFLFGKAASMVRSDAMIIAAVAAFILVAIGVLYKELKLLCFDSGFGSAIGRPVLGLDLLLMGLIALCTVVGLPAVGIVMIVALLIIPGAAARFWTDRLSIMLLLAGGIGMGSGVIGTALSATLPAPASSLSRGWPTGPMIVLTAAACFAVSMLLAPRRGVVSRVLRRVRLRMRTSSQHLLRAAYELREVNGDRLVWWRPEELLALRRVPRWSLALQLALARRAGAVEREGERWRLTDAGIAEAERVVRTHRLWELYLIEFADIAPDHVDRDADEIEHVLPPELLRRLEERLVAGAHVVEPIPASPHPLGHGHDAGDARAGGEHQA